MHSKSMWQGGNPHRLLRQRLHVRSIRRKVILTGDPGHHIRALTFPPGRQGNVDIVFFDNHQRHSSRHQIPSGREAISSTPFQMHSILALIFPSRREVCSTSPTASELWVCRLPRVAIPTPSSSHPGLHARDSADIMPPLRQWTRFRSLLSTSNIRSAECSAAYLLPRRNVRGRSPPLGVTARSMFYSPVFQPSLSTFDSSLPPFTSGDRHVPENHDRELDLAVLGQTNVLTRSVW
jgi:hypothetical protein